MTTTLPPGPSAHPIRQLRQWLRNPLDYMDRAAAEFGGLFTLRWPGGRTSVIVSDPEILQLMFTHPAFGAPGEANQLARPLLGDHSLILLSGTQHQQRRKLLMPSFHGDRLVHYSQLMRNITHQVMQGWHPDQPFSVRESMQEITLYVILQAVFGLAEGERLTQLKQRLVERLTMTASGFGSTFIFLPFLQQDWGPWSPWGRIMDKQRQCDELIYAEIRDRRAQADPTRTDILNLLLYAEDETGQTLSDVELRDELMTLLFAGYETTAIALTWALYWIHRHPQVRQKLLAELDPLGPNPDPMTLFKLPYLTAVCNETLRLYPPGMLTFTRVVQSPIEVKGYCLTPGTEVIGSVYLTHHRPDLYPEPQAFRPERFLERQYSPYEFLPFGGGSRRCLGMALAQFELRLVLATILQTCDLDLTQSEPLRAVRRGVLLAPETGFTMRLKGQRSRELSPIA